MSAAAHPGRVHQSLSPLRASCKAHGKGRDCRILNLTGKEAFVESFVPLVAGTEVDLAFQLPDGRPVQTQGIVRYHQFRVGFGVEFTRISKDDQSQIARLLG